MQEERIVRFSGQVQGVGFRYTAVRLADGYDVTGYVRNLPGGDVECLIEGDAGQIDHFLDSLRGRMRGYIEGENQKRLAYTGRFDSFSVRF